MCNWDNLASCIAIIQIQNASYTSHLHVGMTLNTEQRMSCLWDRTLHISLVIMTGFRSALLRFSCSRISRFKCKQHLAVSIPYLAYCCNCKMSVSYWLLTVQVTWLVNNCRNQFRNLSGYTAAMNGHVGVLNMLEQTCQLDLSLYVYPAAQGGHLPMVCRLHIQQWPFWLLICRETCA